MPPSIALEDARPGRGSAGSEGGDLDGAQDESSGAQRLDSQGGALSTLGLESSITPAATVDETHRVALLVRKAGENGAGAGTSASGTGSAKGRLGSGMWSSLGMRGVSGSGNGGSDGESATALGGGGFGVDARRYVEGLLSLNR